MGRLQAPDSLTGRLQGLLEALRSRQFTHHAVLAIESDDRSFQWAGAAGDAGPDGMPMRADTPFFIASVDKLFTAAAVLKLCERGQIVLDEGILTYLPRLLIEGLHAARGIDSTVDITVRHLLSHTSGLPDWFVDRPRHGPSVLQRVVNEGDFSIRLDDLIDFARTQPVAACDWTYWLDRLVVVPLPETTADALRDGRSSDCRRAAVSPYPKDSRDC